MIFSSGIYADEPEPRNGKECQDYEYSYGKYVFTARNLIKNGKLGKGARLLKKHLECWDDSEISIELGTLYTYQKRYYLAGLVFKEAGMMDLYNKVERLRIENNTDEKMSAIRESARNKAFNFEKSYRKKKYGTIPLFVMGSLFAGSGFGLFLHDRAFGGTNSPTAQFTLMFSGLSMIGSGILLNLSAERDNNSYHAYKDLSTRQFEMDSILDDDYINPQIENTIKLSSIQTMKNHGTVLILMSLPMLALSVFAIYETFHYVLYNGSIFHFNDDGDEFMYALFRVFIMPEIAAVFTLFPTIFCLVSGIKTLVKASRQEDLSKEPTGFTLNSIAPMIDPVSKTYGVAMGFSF